MTRRSIRSPWLCVLFLAVLLILLSTPVLSQRKRGRRSVKTASQMEQQDGHLAVDQDAMNAAQVGHKAGLAHIGMANTHPIVFNGVLCLMPTGAPEPNGNAAVKSA